jgi:hypothetical protein
MRYEWNFLMKVTVKLLQTLLVERVGLEDGLFSTISTSPLETQHELFPVDASGNVQPAEALQAALMGEGGGEGATEAADEEEADEEEARAEAIETRTAGATGLSFFTTSMVASASRSLASRTAASACLTGRSAFTMSKSSSSSMPWVATPISSAGMGLTDLARLRWQRMTSSMAAMPPRSEPAPTAIGTVSMVPLPASGMVSPALIAGGVIVRTV